MSENYNCEKCGKKFTQKSRYNVHQNKKSPCIIESKVIETIEKIVDKKLILEESKIKLDSEIIVKHVNESNPNKIVKKKKATKSILETVNNTDILIQNNTNKLTVLDLFCGCGGMSKGLTDAGLDIIAGIDIWDKAIDNYKKNYHHKAICEDLTKLPPDLFCKIHEINKEGIDIIVGGPPCQSFSIAGRRDKNDPRNSLFIEFVKYLKYFNPKAFIMENVIGILSKKTENNEKVIDIIMEQLTKDYNCVICKLYASDFEVPQNRRRAIIIGVRKDLNIIPKEPKVILEVEKRIPVKTILLKKEEIDKSYYLSNLAIEGIKNKKIKSIARGVGFGAQYLNLEKPSFTIPARYWKDGYDALVKYSDTEIRRLTILELKRIQSFPDNYIIEGSKKEAIMQIGNAVACRFAFHLGQYIKNMLEVENVLLAPLNNN